MTSKPTVYAIDDDLVFSSLLKTHLSANQNIELSTFQDAGTFISSLPADVVIVDYEMPGYTGLELMKVARSRNHECITIMLSGQNELGVVVSAYEAGIFHYIIKNDQAMVALDHALQQAIKQFSLQAEILSLRQQVEGFSKYNKIIGESPAITKVLHLIRKVESTDMQVMITGESGTGKELVAHAIHENSTRKNKNFIAVNMGAIPEDLVEAELFGHEKGAFTGAGGKRIGKFEEADKGTIFLDEIGEMSPELQIRLLRVLQENTITRLGSNKEIKLNVRVIAATNKKLHTLVRDGRFRQDLYYRLQGFLIHLPPLRERGDDVLLLARHFLNSFANRNDLGEKKFSRKAMLCLMNHSWPGNIRELIASVERAALLSNTPEIEEEDLLFSEMA